ncbi:MAG: DUF4270 family protein [Bacteroidetes bacterium]|nr:DUF4270 family protein [Bacteroidota bacterium]MBS1630466.1 DUF4270 family protein [Bacteroidota bacterium]
MKLRLLPLALFAGAATLSLSACHEDAIIKSSLTPAVDNVHTFGIGPDFNNNTDTITMKTKTVFQDSLVTSSRGNGVPIYHALGWMQDKYAGTTLASIYAQFVPTTVGTKLSDVPDSVVLELPYAGFSWGDTTVISTLQFNVYAISEGFSKDSSFFNYSSRAVNPTPIGTATIQIGPRGVGNTYFISDSSIALGRKQIRQAPHLRIKLDNNWVKNTFMKAVDSDANYDTYLAQFPGLCIAPADTSNKFPGQYALPYFRLNGGTDLYSSAALLAYVDGNDSVPVQFPYLEDQAAHFNRIRRNSSGYPLQNITSQYLAMQNAPGAAIDLQLPYIKELPDNIIINKAEIRFALLNAPGQPANDTSKFFPPARLYPQGINSSGGQYTIADRYPINDVTLDFMDGTFSTFSHNGRSYTVYTLNVPRELQQAIIGSSSGLHLLIGGTINFPAAYRLVVAGPDFPDPELRPKLNIIYTKQKL